MAVIADLTPNFIERKRLQDIASYNYDCSCSTILGHSNVSTTLNLYVHPDHQQKRRCIERMSRFIDVHIPK